MAAHSPTAHVTHLPPPLPLLLCLLHWLLLLLPAGALLWALLELAARLPWLPWL